MIIDTTKAQDSILTDRRDSLKLRKYLDEKERIIATPVRELWKKQAKFTTIEVAKTALEQGQMPEEWKMYISKTIREFVRDDVTPAWIQSIGESGDAIAKRVNRLQRKQFDFDSTAINVKGWVDNKGGKLIVNLTEAQMTTIRALLQDQIAMQVTSPYILAQRLKPMIGLTNRETAAVIRFMHSLQEEGLSPSAISAQVEKYTNFLHRARASRIARTEISDAYNFGQLNSLRQARDADWFQGEPEKNWMAGGVNPCEICQENEAAGYIALDAAFPSGDEHPTAHPNCLLAKTPVLVPAAVKGFKASYNGPLLRIMFVGGDITVTPNHIFLTSEGFARASSLRKGDKILYSLFFEREMLGHPDNNGKPPMIEQIVASLTKTSGMTTYRVPASPKYLHGDAAFMNGDIDIIAPDSFLRSDSKTIFPKFISKNSFTSSHIRRISFSGNGNLASMLFRLRDATDGGMGSRRESLAFNRRSNIFPHKFSNFTFSSPLNSSLDKSPNNNGPTYSETLCNLIFRFSSEISLRDVLDIQVIFPHCTLPVYDIETLSSLYIANGLVSSNCECSLGLKIRR